MTENNYGKPTDNTKKSIRNIFWLYVLLFSAVIGQLLYFTFVTSKSIMNDPHNPRLVVMDSEMRRGAIYDSAGNVLAQSNPSADEGYVRQYPFAKSMAHLVGYVGRGKAGIEASYNFELQKLHHEVFQRVRKLFAGEELIGNSITLTIEPSVQKAAYEQLSGKKGAVIAIEPDTGKVLAMASFPDFDPNQIAASWDTLNEREDAPFLNRAAQGLYTPGSVFKIITTAAIIENNENYGEELYVCDGEVTFDGKVIHCFDSKKHGELALNQAFAYSCNTFFSNEAMTVGAQKLIDSAKKRYFGSSFDFRLEHNKSVFSMNADATASEITETAIGQGKTVVTPLHVALITAAVENGGIMMRPYVVDYVTAYNGKIVSKNLPKMLNSVFTVESAQAIKDMMLECVEYGTGAPAKVSGAIVGGKTGTAQNPNGTSHSWFTSFAEANGKKVVVTVVLENPDGGQTALPIAKNVLQAAINTF